MVERLIILSHAATGAHIGSHTDCVPMEEAIAEMREPLRANRRLSEGHVVRQVQTHFGMTLQIVLTPPVLSPHRPLPSRYAREARS